MHQLKTKKKELNYDCVICMDLCRKPVSCLQCHKLLCYYHLRQINNKCPHCRLEPFKFKPETMVESFIDIEIRKQKQEQKRNNTFKCLVQGCGFSGKFAAMEFHRKSKHYEQKIDDILFPEDREAKVKRDAVKKLFLTRFLLQAKKYYQQALLIYVKIKGAVEIGHLMKMLAHFDKCTKQSCRELIISHDQLYIGRRVGDTKIASNCDSAMQLRVALA